MMRGRGTGRRLGVVLALVAGLVLPTAAAAAPLRYETALRIDAGTPRAAAIQISRTLHPGGGVDAVVLAREDTFPDALGAAALSADVGGPLLLTPPDRLAGDTRQEIQRLLGDGGTVYLLGGPAALGGEVERALDELGHRTPRFPGVDRIQTAAMIGRFVGPGDGGEVLLVRAAGSPDLEQGWVDSVSCGGYAADRGVPVLLTNTASPTVSGETWDTLASIGARRVHVCGGPMAVPDSQVAQLRDAGYDVRRHAGIDRAATAVAVAQGLWNVPQRDGRTFVLVPGYGTQFGFGLVASSLSAALDAPILLVDTVNPTGCDDPLAGPTLCFLADGSAGAEALVAVGGTDIVSDDVLVAAAEAADLPVDDDPPSVPAGLTVEDVPEDDGTVLEVAWSASTGEPHQVTYTVHWRERGADTWNRADTTETTRVLTGLTAGQEYEVAVDARDVFDNRSNRSPVVRRTPRDEVPASPGDQGPTVAARPGGGIDVSWIPAPESDVVGYELQRLDARNDPLVGSSADCDPEGDLNSATWETVGPVPLRATRYADTEAQSGRPYCYRYRPVDSTDNRPAFSAPNGPAEAS